MLAGWKTLIFSAAIALIGVAQTADWANLLGATKAGYVMMGVGVLSALLRLITNGPSALTK